MCDRAIVNSRTHYSSDNSTVIINIKLNGGSRRQNTGVKRISSEFESNLLPSVLHLHTG